MKRTNRQFLLLLTMVALITTNCQKPQKATFIHIYPDSVISDVSHHPIGINVDYFTDDDNYLKPARRTADALKVMGVKYLRYPGGNKSDFYFFSVPPYEESIPTLARTGKGAVGGRHRMLKDYSGFAVDVLDFDEFMTMCQEIGAEPVICVAADEYLVDYPEGCTWSDKEKLIEHAVEWVRYANIKNDYNVKYWMIGNESWHRQNENSTPEVYANDVIDFSKAMKAVDPSIYIIPNGNSIDFWEKVIKIAGDHIDHLCFSNYPVYEYKTGYATYRDTIQDLMHPVNRVLTAIEKFATPEQKKKWKLINAEYGPFDWGNYWPKINNMGMNLTNFEMTGEQLLEPSLLFSCFWNTRWINNDSIENSAYDALDKDGNFNANGMGLMIWGNYLHDKIIRTTSILHLRSYASFDPEQRKVFVYLINKLDESRHVRLHFEDYESAGILQSWELVAEGPDDCDPVWREFTGFRNTSELNLEGTSITVLEYQLEELPD